MSPPWLKLVRHHHRRRRLGLTLPFLVGALREPIGARFENADEGYAALVSLLARFRDESPESEMARLFTCPELGQPVVSVVSTYYHPSYAAWGLSPPTRTPLSIDPPYRPERPDDLTAAAKLLWSVVSSAIEEGKFAYSRRTGAYREFAEGDRNFIVDALAYDEENEL